MFQITADLSTLSHEQREFVSDFILNFPSDNVVTDNPEPTIIPSLSVYYDGDEPSPEVAFAATDNRLAELQDDAVVRAFSLVPTQAVASTATVAAALPALPTTGAAALDKDGLPWDERIHSSNRAINADGSWRTKRGVDKTLLATVESELKALMGIPAIPTPPPVTDAPAAAVGTADARNAFVKLLSKATSLIQGNKLTQEELSAAVVSCGIPSLPLLGNRLDLVPQVEATIDAMTAGR